MDGEAKTASVFYIDYGNQDEAVSFSDMWKSLICFEYAAQAHKCQMSKYQGPARPGELDQLHELLVDKPCVVRVAPGTVHPSVIDIRVLALSEDEMDAVFERIRPTVVAIATPQTPSMSSADPNDSIFDVDSSDFSDDVYPIFDFQHYDTQGLDWEPYRPLQVPERRLLPIRIVRMAEDDVISAYIQPARRSPNDSPSEWQQQVEDFARLDSELQRSAPLLPDMDVVDHGLGPLETKGQQRLILNLFCRESVRRFTGWALASRDGPRLRRRRHALRQRRVGGCGTCGPSVEIPGQAAAHRIPFGNFFLFFF